MSCQKSFGSYRYSLQREKKTLGRAVVWAAVFSMYGVFIKEKEKERKSHH